MQKKDNNSENQTTPKGEFIKAYPGDGNTVMYETANAEEIWQYLKGSRSWRNHNPGNIRFSNFTINHGTIGHAGGFACFPDKETGREALIALFQTNSYKNLTIEAAIHRYAPPSENDTGSYLDHVLSVFGVTADTLIKELTQSHLEKLATIIEKHEGYIIGQIRKVNKNERYIWRTKMDERVRESHRLREGKVFYWHKPPQGGHPGEDINCRCRAEKYNIKNRDIKDISEDEVKEVMQTKEYQTDIEIQKVVEKFFQNQYDKKKKDNKL